MNKSKIEWCDSTWNPVTGCLHNCTYCYARRIAERFGTKPKWETVLSSERIVDEKPVNPYPYGFQPTFHRYRLDEPKAKTKPQNIFVCSMADLFGEWVPDEWIQEVFKACEAAPQHRYMFLTKNADRYVDIINNGIITPKENYWFGTTVTGKDGDVHKRGQGINTFVSIEPLLEDLGEGKTDLFPDWVIVGAQTGPGAKQPEPDWVQSIIDQCREAWVPIFLKNNLNWPIKIQEFPWKESD